MSRRKDLAVWCGYSCGQTKSSNLLTNFLGLWKALELVDNGINEFLLISLINSNRQNSQKWEYKGFYTPKIWPVPEKIAKNTKNIPINSFLFPLFDPTKIFLQYWSEICLQQWEFFWNFHVVIPFIIGPWFIFLHIYYIRVHKWCRIDPDGWFGRLLGVLRMPKNLATPKKHGKIKATPFLNSFKVSDPESEVRISIKILVLKLSNLMTLFVLNCRSIWLQWNNICVHFNIKYCWSRRGRR